MNRVFLRYFAAAAAKKSTKASKASSSSKAIASAVLDDSRGGEPPPPVVVADAASVDAPTEPPPSKNKSSSKGLQDSLKVTLALIEKQFGKGIVSQLGDANSKIHKVESISSGILALDDAIGCGGFPFGRIIEIFGPEASGKTFALSAIAEAQKQGHKCTFIDVEHALDVDYARGMGVNVQDLYISQPDCGEDALDICDHLVRSGTMKIIVVDSVSALLPRMELDSDLSGEKIALQARLMSRGLRKLSPSVSNSGTILIFINQIRNKVGVMFGTPETTSGGFALRFYASLRLDTRRTAIVKNKQGEPTGTTHTIKVVKNKVGAPFKKCTFSMRFGKGISRGLEILEVGLLHNMIQAKGSYYYLHLENRPVIALGQGREQAEDMLSKNAQLMEDCAQELKRIGVQMSKTEISEESSDGVKVLVQAEEEEGEEKNSK